MQVSVTAKQITYYRTIHELQGFLKTALGPEEITWWLRKRVVVTEDPGAVHSSCMVAHNQLSSSSRGSKILLWPP